MYGYYYQHYQPFTPGVPCYQFQHIYNGTPVPPMPSFGASPGTFPGMAGVGGAQQYPEANPEPMEEEPRKDKVPIKFIPQENKIHTMKTDETLHVYQAVPLQITGKALPSLRPSNALGPPPGYEEYTTLKEHTSGATAAGRPIARSPLSATKRRRPNLKPSWKSTSARNVSLVGGRRERWPRPPAPPMRSIEASPRFGQVASGRQWSPGRQPGLKNFYYDSTSAVPEPAWEPPDHHSAL